jgi:hypothetical protein
MTEGLDGLLCDKTRPARVLKLGTRAAAPALAEAQTTSQLGN